MTLMKNSYNTIRSLPPQELVALRREAAKRLAEAQASAQEVADLCDQAAKAARRHRKNLESGLDARLPKT
jgi:hypothetical protein